MKRHHYTRVITARARADFTNILHYTFEQWGAKQMAVYREAINRALDVIHTDPKRGRTLHGYWVVHVKKHTIFYDIRDHTIFIVRILHERMDAPRHLNP